MKLIRASFDRFSFGVLLGVSAFAIFGSNLQAQTVRTKANNTTNLNLTGSWVGGVVPGTGDVALWDSTVTVANTVSLGGNLTFGTLKITNPGGLVTINSNTLTLAANGIAGVGIDMSSATADLTINSNITITDTPAAPIWTVAAGRTLTIGGDINEAGGALKTLTIAGAGNVIINGKLTGGGDIALAKNGTGTLTITGNSSYNGSTVINGGALVISGNGDIQSSASTTINNATLSLDNTATNKNDRIGNKPITMNSGTLNFIHGATAGQNYSETTGTLNLTAGASTIRTDVSATGNSSRLTFASISRTLGATVNFVGGPSAANDDNNVRFAAGLAGNAVMGGWATVGGTSFAFYNTASGTDSVEAITTYDQTVTRLSSGTKIIANTAANNVQITDGTGTAADITLAAATTTINTLTNSAPGTTSPAGGVTINPAGQTLQVGGILNAAGSSALTIGNGTNNGTLTSKIAGGEIVIQNFASNAVTVNSVIANNAGATDLTKAGTGSVIVTAANTYSGGTFVNQGTLQVTGTAGALANTSNVTVNTGGTLLLSSTTAAAGGQINDSATVTLAGGTIQAGINGLNETFGVLTLTADSIIDFGTFASSTLKFADSHLASWDSSAILSIWNWTPHVDHLYFGTNNTGLTSTQLGQINFYSDSGVTRAADGSPAAFNGTPFDGVNGEVSAVPEPSSVLIGLGLVGMIGWRERKRFRGLLSRSAVV